MIKKPAPHMNLINRIVSDYFNSKAFSIERVLRGGSTYVYRAQLDGNTYYLRILPEHNMSFEVEVQVHAGLRQKNVQVPEVIYYENRNEALGMSIMLVKEIRGIAVGDCSSLDESEDILFEAGKQLARINQVKVDGFGWIIRDNETHTTTLRGEKTSLQEHIYALWDEDLFLISEQFFNNSDITQIKSIINSGIELMTRHDSHLIHGDFDDSHIFHEGGKYTGIIDFGEIQGSSPLYDLGHYKLHDDQKHLHFKSLIKGYNEAEPLSNHDLLEIELWTLWIGVRRLGMIGKRAYGAYHENLIKTVKNEIDLLNNK